MSAQKQSGQPSAYQLEEITPSIVTAWKECASDREWIHGPQDPLRQANGWAGVLAASTPQTVIVWKAGLGYVPRLLREQYSQCRLIVCENRLGLLWEWLCRWDSAMLLDAELCLLVTDEDLFSQTRDIIQRYPQLVTNGNRILPGSVLSETDQASMHQLQAMLQATPKQPAVYQKSRAFCVMSRSPENVFAAVLRGAEALGYSTVRAERSPALSRFLRGMNTWKQTCGIIPEIALGFYGSLFHPEELADMGHEGVKRVCWFYDRVYDLDPSMRESFDLALTFDRGHLRYLQPIFGTRAGYLPAATGFERFEPQETLQPPAPITFVGATGLRRSMQYIAQDRQRSMQLMQIINQAIRTGWELSPLEFQQELIEKTQHLNPKEEPKFIRFVLQLAANRLRVSYLSAAQPYGLAIYGDALWGKREFTGNLAQSYVGYSLDYETQTPEVYAASKINLHLFHPQIDEGIPMRVYDVMACGGFLLSQYRPVLEEFFTIGKDLDVFHTPSELAETIEYYRQHENERAEIARHGRETVLMHHTYKHRIAQLIEWLDGKSDVEE